MPALKELLLQLQLLHVLALKLFNHSEVITPEAVQTFGPGEDVLIMGKTHVELVINLLKRVAQILVMECISTCVEEENKLEPS